METLAEQYQDDIRFAFFVAEFGYNREEYEALTERQIAFIQKAWEQREVRRTTLINLAVNNAMANSYRKRGSSPIPLFGDNKADFIDAETAKEQMKSIEKTFQNAGKDWIKKIWAGNRQ